MYDRKVAGDVIIVGDTSAIKKERSWKLTCPWSRPYVVQKKHYKGSFQDKIRKRKKDYCGPYNRLKRVGPIQEDEHEDQGTDDNFSMSDHAERDNESVTHETSEKEDDLAFMPQGIVPADLIVPPVPQNSFG